MSDLDKFIPFAIVKDSYAAAEKASKASEALYPEKEQWKGKGDAFRHMAWQALLQKQHPTLAKVVGYYHELPIGRTLGGAALEQTPEERQMDLANNALGRDIAMKAKNLDEMYKMLQDAIKSGKAKYLTQDEIDYQAALESLQPTDNYQR